MIRIRICYLKSYFLELFLDFFANFLKSIFENTKMYKISRIPTVFITPRTINHIGEPFRADFHKANNFQTKDQIMINTPNIEPIPKAFVNPK